MTMQQIKDLPPWVEVAYACVVKTSLLKGNAQVEASEKPMAEAVCPLEVGMELSGRGASKFPKAISEEKILFHIVWDYDTRPVYPLAQYYEYKGPKIMIVLSAYGPKTIESMHTISPATLDFGTNRRSIPVFPEIQQILRGERHPVAPDQSAISIDDYEILLKNLPLEGGWDDPCKTRDENAAMRIKAQESQLASLAIATGLTAGQVLEKALGEEVASNAFNQTASRGSRYYIRTKDLPPAEYLNPVNYAGKNLGMIVQIEQLFPEDYRQRHADGFAEIRTRAVQLALARGRPENGGRG